MTLFFIANKYISGDLLYSGVNLFGKLSEIYLEKIKNGEMHAGMMSGDLAHKELNYQAPQNQEYSTPSLVKTTSTASVTSSSSAVTNAGMVENSRVFQMNQEIMSLFRKLQKKDSITKVKALKALQKYVEKLGEVELEIPGYAEEGT